jgi:tRNA threonylcarbamoyladenosine biosynthesis protein TsaB
MRGGAVLRVIAIEASTARVSVAFVDDGHAAARRFEAVGRLSGVLVPSLRELATEAWPLSAAELIVTAGGPGSFTGLRVGMAAAKGLAFVTALPVVAVSSLAAIASAAGIRGNVVAVLDARGGYYFYAVYDCSGGYPGEAGAAAIGDAETVAALPYDVFAGPPAQALREGTRRAVRWLEVWPDAVVLARLGVLAFRLRGADDLATLKPTYLKRGQV